VNAGRHLGGNAGTGGDCDAFEPRDGLRAGVGSEPDAERDRKRRDGEECDSDDRGEDPRPHGRSSR
jgi:hypothetical protein